MGNRRGRHGFGAARLGASNYFVQDVGMGSMYAVEVSNTDHCGPEVSGHVVEFVEYLHKIRGARA